VGTAHPTRGKGDILLFRGWRNLRIFFGFCTTYGARETSIRGAGVKCEARETGGQDCGFARPGPGSSKSEARNPKQIRIANDTNGGKQGEIRGFATFEFRSLELVWDFEIRASNSAPGGRGRVPEARRGVRAVPVGLDPGRAAPCSPCLGGEDLRKTNPIPEGRPAAGIPIIPLFHHSNPMPVAQNEPNLVSLRSSAGGEMRKTNPIWPPGVG
jgi:hypothetical protein